MKQEEYEASVRRFYESKRAAANEAWKEYREARERGDDSAALARLYAKAVATGDCGD